MFKQHFSLRILGRKLFPSLWLMLLLFLCSSIFSPGLLRAEDGLESDLFGSASDVNTDELVTTNTVVDESTNESSSESSNESLNEADFFSDDSMDEQMFSETQSGQDVSEAADNAFDDSGTESSFKDMLDDKDSQFDIGGKFYHAFNVTGTDSQKARNTDLSSEGVADIYFDASLDDGVRFFMKQKIKEDFTATEDDNAAPVSFAGPEASTSIDQMWLKFAYQNKLYMTFGKQPNAWGSGFVWAPTDFINSETASPFALSDQRLGVSLIKVEYPMDDKGINLYGVIQTTEVSEVQDVRTLFRAEILGQQSEYALSLATQSHGQMNLGFDLSMGLSIVDVFLNVSATKHDEGPYYEAPPGIENLTSEDYLQLLQSGIDGGETEVPENAQLTVVDRSGEIIKQLSTGFIYMKGYNDGSQLILNSEFFYNEKGYESSDILTLYLLQDPSAFDPLYFSKRYLALGLTRAGLGNASQSYGLQYLRNLSDDSGAIVLSFNFSPFNDLRFASNAILFTGQGGTFRPFANDTEELEGTAQLVADGGLDIPPGMQQNLPVFLQATGTDPVEVTVGETSFEGPRYMLSTQLSLSF